MQDKKAILKFQHDIGVDEAIIDTSYQDTKPLLKEKTISKKEFNIITEAQNNKKEDVVASIESLDELKNYILNFKDLDICHTANNTVICDGNPNSKIMLLGEAPGANEDAQGIPFCGQSGKLLDNMLKAINLSRAENIYISNNVFWRPPGNRRPTPEELDICQPMVEKHISLIKPQLLLLFGATAVSATLRNNIGISKLRGQVFKYTNKFIDYEIPVIATFHPSYLLRQPSQKKTAWQDLQMIQKYIIENNIQVK